MTDLIFNDGVDFDEDATAADLAAYALGALDADAALRVEERVAEDADAARELEAMLETVAAISAMVGTAAPEPPEHLQATILAAAEADTSNRRRAASASLLQHIEREVVHSETQPPVDDRGWLARLADGFSASRLAFATSLATFGIVVIVTFQLGVDNSHLNQRVAEMDRTVQTTTEYADLILRELEVALTGLNEAEVRMQEQAAQIESMTVSSDALRQSFNDQMSLTYATLQEQYRAPNWLPDSTAYTGGYAHLLESRFSQAAALVIGGVAPAPPGQEFRLYLTSGDTAEFAASFNVNAAGYGIVSFPLRAPLSAYDGAHITIEQAADAPDPTLAEPANRYKPQ